VAAVIEPRRDDRDQLQLGARASGQPRTRAYYISWPPLTPHTWPVMNDE
jgi:hypothetical protein